MSYQSRPDGHSPADLLRLPQFDERAVTIRWHHDWWDGPLDGTIEYAGSVYWFSFYCDTDEPRNPYYYRVFRLNAEEVAAADRWFQVHDKFGAEWRPLANDPASKGLPATKVLEEQWEAHRSTLPDFTQREPVAWFVSGANPDFYAVQIEPA